jgi:hypothetical protein
MSAIPAAVHLAFADDKKARCGKRYGAKSPDLGSVTCVRCIEAADGPIRLTPSLTGERRAVVKHLAQISGKTVVDYLDGVLVRAVDELRLPFPNSAEAC